MSLHSLASQSKIRIIQRKEFFELAGFETRNKYEICSVDGENLGFVAEQGKGFMQSVGRQFLGHWRTFELNIYNQDKQQIATAKHPFKFYFSELHIRNASGESLGELKKKFSLLYKKFDMVLASGEKYEVSSPFWKIWTFPVIQNGKEIAVIRKKWSGGLKEIFTDADNFEVEFISPSLSVEAKTLILSAGVFIDLQYFEAKAGD